LDLLLALTLAGVYFAWTQPLLGRPLEITPPAFTARPPVGAEPAAVSTSAPAAQAAPTALPAAAFSAAQVKPAAEDAGENTLLILALGIDNNAQADAIAFVRIDMDERKVTVLSIPRDLYIPIRGFEDHNITEGRINATFGYGEYFNGSGKGVEAIASNIAAYFGLTFDQYGVAHMGNITSLIDRIGGIDIYLDKPVDGRTQGVDFYAAGPHHLDGKHTVEFLRIRFPDSDHQRIVRRSLVISALMDRLLSSANILDLAAFGVELIREKGIQTDLSAEDVYTLIQFAKTLSPEDITYLSLPAELYDPTVTSSGAAVLMPREGLVEFVRERMAR
jgi:LCP family protein required for cell wall assembly